MKNDSKKVLVLAFVAAAGVLGIGIYEGNFKMPVEIKIAPFSQNLPR